MARRNKITLNGKCFNSVMAAAKYFKVSYAYFNKLVNHDPEALDRLINKEAVNNRRGGTPCGVTCSDGTTFKSIRDASKHANAKMWTMSLKMETTGKFVDKNGNEYYRNSPMRKRSDREYSCKTSTVRDIKEHVRQSIKHDTIVNVAARAVNNHNVSVLDQLATQAKAQIDVGNYATAIKLCDAMSVLRQLIK